MKKLSILILCLSILACLAACHITADTTNEISAYTKNETSTETTIETTSETTRDTFQEYFDFNKEHYPSEENVLSIQWGTPILEAIDKIGKPHSKGPMSGRFTLQWETAEGGIYYFAFAFMEIWPGMDLNIYTDSVVSSTAMKN